MAHCGNLLTLKLNCCNLKNHTTVKNLDSNYVVLILKNPQIQHLSFNEVHDVKHMLEQIIASLPRIKSLSLYKMKSNINSSKDHTPIDEIRVFLETCTCAEKISVGNTDHDEYICYAKHSIIYNVHIPYWFQFRSLRDHSTEQTKSLIKLIKSLQSNPN